MVQVQRLSLQALCSLIEQGLSMFVSHTAFSRTAPSYALHRVTCMASVSRQLDFQGADALCRFSGDMVCTLGAPNQDCGMKPFAACLQGSSLCMRTDLSSPLQHGVQVPGRSSADLFQMCCTASVPHKRDCFATGANPSFLLNATFCFG